MSYKYTLSITWTEMGQLNTYSPIYFNDKGLACNPMNNVGYEYEVIYTDLYIICIFLTYIHWWSG